MPNGIMHNASCIICTNLDVYMLLRRSLPSGSRSKKKRREHQ